MKRKIILHVGMHKTGTTTIQNQLYEFRHSLKELGIIYPNLNNTGANHSIGLYSLYSKEPENYHMNVRSGRVTKEKLNEFHKGILTSLEQVNLNDWHSMILSGEDISVLGVEQLNSLKSSLLSIFPGSEFIVVCAFRNPLSYWKSAIIELIKNGFPLDGLKAKLGANSYYENLVKKLADVFGTESLKLYKFEDSIKDNITEYFITNFVSNELNIRFDNSVDNSSICQEAFYFLSEYNNKFPLIVDGNINPERALNDTEKLLKLSGGRCVDVGINLYNEISTDLMFLDKQYGLSWEVIEQEVNNNWSDCFMKNLYKIMPYLEEKLKDVVIEKVRDQAMEHINKDHLKAIEMLLFCNFYRPKGPLIKSTLQKLALTNGIDLFERNGVLVKSNKEGL